MLQVSAKLLQNPVLLSSSCSNISCSQMIPLVGHVAVNASKRQKIGGVRVIWESVVRRKLISKKGKPTWTAGDQIEQFEVDVIQGPYWLPAGQTVFEFVIEVPLTLVSSRVTAFDAISHLLHVAVLDTLPCYDRLVQPDQDRPAGPLFSLSSLASSLVSKRATTVKPFDCLLVLAHSTSPLNVFSCDTEDDVTAYNFAYQTDMDGLGCLKLSINSQQLVLGSSAAVHLDVTGLSPETTIHTVDIDLVQTTCNACCPSKYSSSGSISSDAQPQDTEVTDKFQLHSYGIPWPFMYTRPRPYRGSYVWRGHEAARYTSERLSLGDLRADRIYDDGFGHDATITIPSPIIGAMATSTKCDPAFAMISHHLDIKLTYSILDQGTGGIPLPRSPDETPKEGQIRSWTLEKSLVIHSDLSSATATAAPPYSSADSKTHHCIVEPKINLKSTKALRSTSLGVLRSTNMRPVRMEEDDVRRWTQRHWDETGGLCACFDQSEVCVCARPPIIPGRQAKTL